MAAISENPIPGSEFLRSKREFPGDETPEKLVELMVKESGAITLEFALDTDYYPKMRLPDGLRQVLLNSYENTGTFFVYDPDQVGVKIIKYRDDFGLYSDDELDQGLDDLRNMERQGYHIISSGENGLIGAKRYTVPANH